MIAQYHQEYTALGLSVYPIEWDVEKKEPKYHPHWSEPPHPLSAQHNAMMIKTSNEYACLDFDLKNTENKKLYEQWLNIILNERPEIYSKVYVEQTRNAGYHVWIKYSKLTHKLSLADSKEGHEVIALYAMNPLVYTYPTPGYTEVHSSMGDVDFLTDDEFEYIIGLSQYFNEYKPKYDPNKKAIAYPSGYEEVLSIFDKSLPDDAWVEMLSQIGLAEMPCYRKTKKQHFSAYRRKGSASDAISAKIYFKNKRACIFSASLHDFPNWHNRHEYPIWSLPPSFVLFYKNNRDWELVIQEVLLIADASGMDLPELPARLTTDFPLHVFPDKIRDSILEVSAARSLAPQFVATAGLWTISSLAGARYFSAFNGDARNILFCLLVAPVSVGKTPAFKVMCETPLSAAQEKQDEDFKQAIADYEKKKEESDKKFTAKRPARYIPIAVDGTTEGYIHKSMSQPNGIGVYQDEAETILNAGSFKNNNDAVSFFTQAFSGGRISQIRADEQKERVVPNLNLNLLMGTQPARLQNIFTEDRLASGFASRFLMVEAGYQELNVDADPFHERKEMCEEWVRMVTHLYTAGHQYNADPEFKTYIAMPEAAKNVYRNYYRQLLTQANTRIQSKAETYVIGTEAKMSAYFPRLIQILSIIHNYQSPTITEQIVHWGWELYRYFADSTIRIISSLHTELETGLPKDLELLYQALPDEFTRAEAVSTCERVNLQPRRFDVSIRRKDFGKLFQKTGQGKYRKV